MRYYYPPRVHPGFRRRGRVPVGGANDLDRTFEEFEWEPEAPGTGPPPPAPGTVLPTKAELIEQELAKQAAMVRPPPMPPPPPPVVEPPPAKATLFGLPPVAVYVGLGALGLLAVAAVAKKRKRKGAPKRKRRRAA